MKTVLSTFTRCQYLIDWNGLYSYASKFKMIFPEYTKSSSFLNFILKN